MTGQVDTKKRKRGVKASRTKLEKALFNAGLKTQSALAEKIAEKEGLDTSPKDLVNKVFRGVSVSPNSLERIASALDVDAFTLYQSSDEFSHNSSTNPFNTALSKENELPQEVKLSIGTSNYEHNNDKSSLTKYAYMALILLGLVIGCWFLLSNEGEANNSTLSSLLDNLEPPQHKYSLAVQVSGEILDQSKQIQQLLATHFHVVPSLFELLTTDSRQIEQSSQVDFVVTQKVQTYGRYWLVETRIQKHPSTIVVDRRYFNKVNFNRKSEAFYKEISDKIINLASTGLSINSVEPQISEAYLKYVLEGLALLDDSNDLNNVKSAQSRFMLAQDAQPELAEAYAGLCFAYLYESWSGDEKGLLSKAEKECKTAADKQPNLPLVVASNGFLLRRTGRLDDARTYLSEKMSNYSEVLHSPVVLMEQANMYLELYRKNGDSSQLLDYAKKALLRAAEIEPNYWKTYFLLGLVEWTAGNKREAINANKSALKYNENDIVLSNLTALSLCIGDIEPAKGYVEKALDKAPDSYLALETMSALHYFSHNFSTAIEYRLESMKNAGEDGIHEMWGALADSYYFNHNKAKAITAYQKALSVIDRDYARGNQTLTHKAYRQYYLVKLHLLDREGYPLGDDIDSELSYISEHSSALDSGAVARVALTFYYLNFTKQAQKYRKLASERCPVYQQLPDWNNTIQFAKLTGSSR